MKRIKRKIRVGRVLILFFSLIFIVGGIVMIYSLKYKDDSKNQGEEVNESDSLEVGDDSDVNDDLEKAPSHHQEFLELKDGRYLTEKGYTLSIENGIAYVDGMIIVNKTYSVPESYVPVDSYEPITTERCNQCINKEVMEAFRLMQSDATSLGLHIYIASGYRGYTYQERLYGNYVSMSGKEKADTYSARPGHSEHQTGTCFDLNTVDDSFAYTNEGKWVNENAYLYGFIIRYPKGKETITGYQYESWHLRYVGKELASKLYRDGDWMTIEEYYGLTSRYE